MNEDRQHIIDKVTTLYNKYGIKSITMDDVAREMGISKKTLYQHFSDKKELVAAVVNFQQQQWESELEEIRAASKNAIDELFRVHSHVNEAMKLINPAVNFDLHKYYPDIHRHISMKRRENMHTHLTNNMHMGIKQGLYRKDINVDIIAKLYLLRVENLVENEMMEIAECTSESFFREVFIYHLRGISNDKGIRVLNEYLKTETNSEITD